MVKRSKRKVSKVTKKMPIAKRTKYGFAICAKSYYLTYACPRHLFIHPLSRCIIAYFFHTMFTMFDIICVYLEHHVDGKVHYHVLIQDTSSEHGPFRSKDSRVFDIEGIHPNFSKRKDGKKKYSKYDFLTYCMKEDKEPLFVGIDVPTYISEFEKKGATKLSVIARDIYHNGLNLKKMCKGEHASIVMMHQKKLEDFDETCQVVKYEPMIPLRITINPGWPKCLRKIAQWWNYRCVEGRWKKKLSMLYIFSIFFTKGKSTLLKVMLMIMNGHQGCWCWNDAGWQEQFQLTDRLLGVDALNGRFSHFHFGRLLELMDKRLSNNATKGRRIVSKDL